MNTSFFYTSALVTLSLMAAIILIAAITGWTGLLWLGYAVIVGFIFVLAWKAGLLRRMRT